MRDNKDLFVSTVVVAAGSGSRMKMDINKQYIEVAGKPVVARSLQKFQDCQRIKEIILVVAEEEVVYCKRNIVDRYGLSKVKAIVAGGDERQKSVFNGLKEVDSSCDIVLIHDGARPFISQDVISQSIDSATEHAAVGVAVPVKDTIKIVDQDNCVIETPDRSTLWAIQTPQSFRYKLIMDAHIKAVESGFSGTDDAVLVERLGFKLKLIMGSYDNIKITTKEDLPIAEAIARGQE